MQDDQREAQAEAQAKGAGCLSERYIREDKVGKAARAGVQLPEQESSAYKIKREIAQRARP
jgi:hypothetical protein